MRKRRSIFPKYRGTPAFPRYIIAESNGKVWTGKRWVSRGERPLLFASLDEAAKTCHVLLQKDYRDARQVERFVLALHVEVRSKNGISLDEIRRWLRKAMSVYVGSADLGNGPTNDSLVLVNLDWGEFFQIDSRKVEEPPQSR